MKLPLLFVPLLCATSLLAAERPAGIPEDYKLLYEQKFTSPEALQDFVFTDASAWKITTAGDRSALELTKQSNYKPTVRSPFNIALLKMHVFCDVIIEADCQQTGKEYGHRDMVLVYGFQGPSKFYYTHIATKADDHAHNCFIVNDAPRVKFAKETTSGADWGLNTWRHIRLERKASDGTVRVWFDDMSKPIMAGQDKTFGPGWIGFGSFDDTGMITNIRVWGKSAEKKEAPEFPKTEAK